MRLAIVPLPPEILERLHTQFRISGGVLYVGVAEPKLQSARVVTASASK